MVNLLPFALITIATFEVIGDALQIAVFSERTQGFALGYIVEVAHHDDAWDSAFVTHRINGLAQMFGDAMSQLFRLFSVEATWQVAYEDVQCVTRV